MKKTILVLGLWLTGGLCLPASAMLKVITTTEDLASITKSLGSELVEVTFLARGTQDPHFLEAKPSYMVKVSRADIIISVGLALESGWLPLIVQGARRPDLLPGNKGYIEASAAVTPIEVNAAADRSQGDVHPQGNPHFMADPQRAMDVAVFIANKLAEADPANAEKYRRNSKQYVERIQKRITEWKKRLAKYHGTKVIGYHKTFNYFFKFFDLNVVGFLEPKPGIPPGAQHVLELTEKAKSEKVKLVMIENFFDPKPANVLTEQSGAKLVVLPAYVGGSETSTSYENWMEELVVGVEKSLGAIDTVGMGKG